MPAFILLSLVLTGIEPIDIPIPGLNLCFGVYIEDVSYISAGGYLFSNLDGNWQRQVCNNYGFFKEINNKLYMIEGGVSRIDGSTFEPLLSGHIYDFIIKDGVKLAYSYDNNLVKLYYTAEDTNWTQSTLMNLPVANYAVGLNTARNLIKSIIWNDKVLLCFWQDGIFQSDNGIDSWAILECNNYGYELPLLGIWTKDNYLFFADQNGLYKVDTELNCTKVAEGPWNGNLRYASPLVNKQDYPILFSVPITEDSLERVHQQYMYYDESANSFITLPGYFMSPQTPYFSNIDSTIWLALRSDQYSDIFKITHQLLKYPKPYTQLVPFEDVNAGSIVRITQDQSNQIFFNDYNTLFKWDKQSYSWAKFEQYDNLEYFSLLKIHNEYVFVVSNRKLYRYNNITRALDDITPFDNGIEYFNPVNLSFDPFDSNHLILSCNGTGVSNLMYDSYDIGNSWQINKSYEFNSPTDVSLCQVFIDSRNPGARYIINRMSNRWTLWTNLFQENSYFMLTGDWLPVSEELIFPPDNPEVVIWPTQKKVYIYNTGSINLSNVDYDIDSLSAIAWCIFGNRIYMMNKDHTLYFVDGDITQKWNQVKVEFPFKLPQEAFYIKNIFEFSENELMLIRNDRCFIISIPETSIPSILYAQPLIISPSVGAGPFRLAGAFGNDLPTWSLFDIKGRLVGNGASMYIDPQRLQLTSGNYYVHSQLQVKKIIVTR